MQILNNIIKNIQKFLTIFLTWIQTGKITTADRSEIRREFCRTKCNIDEENSEESSSDESSVSSDVNQDATQDIVQNQKRALCIAINNYPGTSNDLRGCVNDALLWENLLTTQYGFSPAGRLFDSYATRKNVKNAMSDLIRSAVAGDTLVITFSGHGTSVPNPNTYEKNGRDEALCLYDGLLLDKDVRNIMDKIPEGVKVTVIIDSCFSGTMTRLDAITDDGNPEHWICPRYMPPDSKDIVNLMNAERVREIFRSDKQEEDMLEVLVTGSNDSEYSYDTFLGGKFHGAMSYYANQVLRQYPTITYADFHVKLRKILPSAKLPQHPQLEGRQSTRQALMFE